MAQASLEVPEPEAVLVGFSRISIELSLREKRKLS
jgi:hypothetical protein